VVILISPLLNPHEFSSYDPTILVLNRDYENHFNLRGLDYHQAMELYPEIRDLEFRQLFEGIHIKAFNTVIDLPSGGSYLKPYLPASCEILAFDPATGFHGTKESISPISFEDLELPSSCADAVVTLAAMHHIEDPMPFLRKVGHSLKVGGVHLIGDVRAHSPVAHFLDEFCGHHNGLGHKGYFLPDAQEAFGPIPSELHLERYEVRPFLWTAKDLNSMLEFTKGLFGLNQIHDHDLQQGLEKYLNLQWNNQSCSIEWELVYLRICKTN
jgi:SAM-dependent methyltransferase